MLVWIPDLSEDGTDLRRVVYPLTTAMTWTLSVVFLVFPSWSKRLMQTHGLTFTTVVVLVWYVLTILVFFEGIRSDLAVSRRELYMFTIMLVMPFFHIHFVVFVSLHAILTLYLSSMLLAFHHYSSEAMANTSAFICIQVFGCIIVRTCMYVRFCEFVSHEHRIASSARLIAADMNKNFISQSLHDLGTPLSIISFGIQALEDDAKFHDTQFVFEMKLASSHLSTIRRTALEFVRSSHGATDSKAVCALLTPHLRPVNVRKLVDEFAPLMYAFQNVHRSRSRSRSRSNGDDLNEDVCEAKVKLTFFVDDTVPTKVMTEGQLIQDILLNLVSNALKFTRDGYIRVQLSYHDGMLRINVIDTGCGVSDAAKGVIFQAFQQAGDVASHAKGTGLGLWGVQSRTHLLGGTCGVSDHSDVAMDTMGARFWVHIPASSACGNSNMFHIDEPDDVNDSTSPPRMPTPRTRTPSPKVYSACVLIVEDQAVIRRLLVKKLQDNKIDVYQAENGVEGLRMLKEREYNCVMTDLNMPEMDGWEMIRQFRAYEDANRRIGGGQTCIFALSGNSLDDDIKRALDCGADLFFPKPVRVDADVIPAMRQKGCMERTS